MDGFLKGAKARTRDRVQAYGLFITITFLGIIFYLVNNAYSGWAFDPSTNWFLAIVAYYLVTQPIYVAFLWLMVDKYGPKGLVGGILLTIAFDIMSLPHSVPSVLSQAVPVPLTSDLNLSPYPDWQLARALSVDGMITFFAGVFLYIVIPTVLDVVTLLIVKPRGYKKIVQSL